MNSVLKIFLYIFLLNNNLEYFLCKKRIKPRTTQTKNSAIIITRLNLPNNKKTSASAKVVNFQIFFLEAKQL